MRALQAAGVTVLGGPRAISLGVMSSDRVSPGFKTEYGEFISVLLVIYLPHSAQRGPSIPTVPATSMFCSACLQGIMKAMSTETACPRFTRVDKFWSHAAPDDRDSFSRVLQGPREFVSCLTLLQPHRAWYGHHS